MSEIQTCGRRMSEPGPWEVRSCSFCGSAHPDDVMDLLREGWEYEPTGKSYKGYIELPGTRAHQAAVIAHIQDNGMDKPGTCPRPLVPETMLMTGMPSVKFYIHHFSEEQVVELNRLIQVDAGRMAGISTDIGGDA